MIRIAITGLVLLCLAYGSLLLVQAGIENLTQTEERGNEYEY